MLFAEDGAGDAEAPPAAETPAEEAPAEVSAEDAPATRKVITTGVAKKSLDEFNVGDTVKGTVRTITNYGAFIEFGATTDGLLHVSRMSSDFVNDVNDIVSVGQELDVTIVDIKLDRGQVALSLVSEEEVASRGQPQQSSASQERGDTTVIDAVVEAKWNRDKFVLGKVISVLNFGAFVRIDASELAEGVEGQVEGLVHISQLSSSRVSAAADVVKEGQEVSVRVIGIADGKVSMSMIDKTQVDVWDEEEDDEEDDDGDMFEYYYDDDEEEEDEEGEGEDIEDEVEDEEDISMPINREMIQQMLDQEASEEDDDEDAWNHDWDIIEADDSPSEFQQEVDNFNNEQPVFVNDPVFVYRNKGRSEAKAYSDSQPEGWVAATGDVDLDDSEPVVSAPVETTPEPVVAEAASIEPVG